jgi:hypothetical protein
MHHPPQAECCTEVLLLQVSVTDTALSPTTLILEGVQEALVMLCGGLTSSSNLQQHIQCVLIMRTRRPARKVAEALSIHIRRMCASYLQQGAKLFLQQAYLKAKPTLEKRQ